MGSLENIEVLTALVDLLNALSDLGGTAA